MKTAGESLWDESSRDDYPPLEGDATADVCVVGLGGSGLSCIVELLARGKSVVGLDATRVASGAAGRNGGFLLGGLAMFHHEAVMRLGREVAATLYRMTLDELDRMVWETPDAVRRTGSLRIAASAEEQEDCERQLDAMLADSLPVQLYSGDEGRGLLFPRDAAFNPVARCVALARAAAESGARLFEWSPVTLVSNGHVVTPRGTVRAQDTVVAVDGNLERLLPELSPRVRTARLQMLAASPLASLIFPRPVYSRWGLDYWQQLTDGRVVLGGARDVGGDAEWTSSNQPTPIVQDALSRLLARLVSAHAAVAAEVTHRWAASVAYTISGLPILEEVRPHVFAIGGYSGTGNVLGSLAGRGVANLVVSGTSAVADLIRA